MIETHLYQKGKFMDYWKEIFSSPVYFFDNFLGQDSESSEFGLNSWIFLFYVEKFFLSVSRLKKEKSLFAFSHKKFKKKNENWVLCMEFISDFPEPKGPWRKAKYCLKLKF